MVDTCKRDPCGLPEQQPVGIVPVESADHVYRVMDNLSPSVFAGLTTVDGNIIYANRAALDAIGARLEDVVGKPVHATPWLAHSETVRADLMRALQSAAQGCAAHFEFSFETVDGRVRTMDASLHPAFSRDGELAYIVTSAHDISERKRIEQMLGLTHFAIDRAQIALLQVRADGRVHDANDSACRLLGYSRQDLRGMPVEKLSKRVAMAGWAAVWAKLKERGSMQNEATYFRSDGKEIPVEISASHVRYTDEEFGFAFIADLSERKKAERHIHFLAHFDGLTGLPNRASFLGIAGGYLARAQDKHSRAAIIIADIERFWLFNSMLGRAAADELLRQLAERFLHHAEGQNRLGRLGADQFALIMSGVGSESEVEHLVRRKFGECFSAPFVIGGHEIHLSAKFGVGLHPEDGNDAETLLGHAEAALYRAKQTARRIQFYKKGMAEQTTGRLRLEGRLRRALEHKEFVLHYQPKIDLVSQRIEGVEALIRWIDPRSGMVPPVAFMPLLEETGLIMDVGAWALHEAGQAYRRWQAQGVAVPRIAVNVSAVQLHRPDFVQTVQRALHPDGAACGIDLEITETVLMEDIECNIGKLQALREMGFGIGIDDFGTGYSSLAYLTRLPMHTLKIDRSFIATMLDDPDRKTLVSAIISLAHALRLTVVAEGVETRAQADALRLLDCDQMQGFLFSRPLPGDELVNLLRAQG